MQDISDVLAAAIEPFQAPPLVAAPFTTITDLSGNARKLPDPSKTIRPLMGIERIQIGSLDLSANEDGPLGELVYTVARDQRIKCYGNCTLRSDSSGMRLTLATPATLEITFYGTGINLYGLAGLGARDVRATIDGGSEGVNLYPTASSGVMNGRNYASNSYLFSVSGLSEGVHTVRLRAVTTGWDVSAIEIVTSTTQIRVPQGKLINNGRGFSLNSLQSLNATSSFDVGTPNGRGGRVVVYSEGDQLKKAIQPVDLSAAYLSSANHVNEELIRKINFREFGAQRADDFSTLAGVASSRAYTLEDGTTTLAGVNLLVANAANTGLPEFHTTQGTTNFYAITFVGTGLDLVRENQDANPRSDAVFVDGTNVGNISLAGNEGPVVQKIVSGLPYGTHTVRIQNNSGVLNGGHVQDFIIYGPKKPTLPEGAVEVGEYYLLADFVRNTFITNVYGSMSTGVLRKAITYKEGAYNGSWTIGTVNLAYDSGASIFSATNGNSASYTFFGTGFDFRVISTNTTGSFAVTLNGAALNSSYPGASSITIQTYGGPNFGSMGAGATALLSTAANNTLATVATPNNLNAGFVVRNLPLGFHTVTFTKNSAGTTEISTFDVITPVHFPNTKVGSLSIGPGVAIKEAEQKSNLDLSKAKAWLQYDPTGNRIIGSLNISAVLRNAAGDYLVFFERPFKDINFTALTSATKQSGTAAANSSFVEGTSNAIFRNRVRITAVNGAASYDPDRVFLVCFGELEGEGN